MTSVLQFLAVPLTDTLGAFSCKLLDFTKHFVSLGLCLVVFMGALCNMKFPSLFCYSLMILLSLHSRNLMLSFFPITSLHTSCLPPVSAYHVLIIFLPTAVFADFANAAAI